MVMATFAPQARMPWTAPTFQFRQPVSISATEAAEQFRAAMRAAGIEPPDSIVDTGDDFKKFSTNGKPRDDAGWYAFHIEAIPYGFFGNWRTGVDYSWRADIGRPLTPAEESACRQREAAAKAAREVEQAKLRAEAAHKVRALLAAGKPATGGNPYLQKKGINAPPANAVCLEAAAVSGLLGYTPKSKGEALTGELLILPVTIDGELTTCELIDGDGRKSAIYGGAKAGGCWLPAPIPPAAEVIAIGEGAATVLSVAAATGWPVVAALSAGNLPAIARQVRTQHPGTCVVILADLVKESREADPHAVEAAAAVGGLLAVPALNSEEGTDWNDAAAVRGLEAVRAALLSLVETAPEAHPAEIRAAALREATRLAEAIADPVARALALADVGRDHLGSKQPSAALTFIEAAERRARRVYPLPPALNTLMASAEERDNAKLAPRCIVESLFFADVALLSAAGGTGKTSVAIWEAVHVITGRPLYGLKVEQPGPVVLITAEDPRSVCLARLSRIIKAMEPPLSDSELAAVESGFLVWDCSGDMSRLVDIDASGRMMPTGFADAIVETLRPVRPALVVCDPIVSFGSGESRVNDAEQALVIEARRIVRALDCCVRYVTHVSQNAARAGTLDQYASRGGTALADGSRMVSVLAPWKPGDKDEPPITLETPAGAAVLKLARPKLTYCPPLPMIWLARDGYRFTWANSAPPMTPESQLAADADQIEAFLVSELAEKRKHTRATLEQARARLGMNRDPLRRALAELEVARRVVETELPADERIGGRKSFLRPATTSRPHSARS